MALQHLRSSTANKRPIPTQLSAGQIAVNTNEASPGLFFKDSNGDLVKIGPVHVGTSAPNSSPASTAATALVSGTVYQILTVGTTDFTAVGASANTVGVVFTATGAGTGTGTVSGQQGNEKGEQWLDTTGGAYDLKIYDGSAWRSQAGEFVNVTGDNMTGNLTLGTDKVVLNATSGNATLEGDLNTGTFSASSTTTAGANVLASGQINIQQASGSTGYFTRGFRGSTETYYVKADGSASFAGGYTFFNQGYNYFKSPSTGSSTLFQLIDGNDSANVTFKANGSAVFSGTIQSTAGGFTFLAGSGTASSDNFVYLTPGQTYVNRTDNTSPALNLALSGSVNTSLRADGSAAFNGNVVVASSAGSGGTNANSQLGTYNSSNAYIAAYNTNATKVTNSPSFFVYDRTNSAYKARIWQDGSASFAGAISVDGGTTNENSTYGPGYLIQNRSQANRNLWTGQLNGTNTSTILADGSATFAGAVTSSNNISANAFISPNNGNTTRFLISNASGNTVTMTADGAATFAGLITGNGNIVSDRTSGSNTCFQATLNGSTKATINADGSATFAGKVVSGTSSLANTAVEFYNNSSSTNTPTIYARNHGNGRIFAGVNASATTTSSIDANGAATFIGNTQIGSSSNGVLLANNGAVVANTTDTSTNKKFILNSSGSETFSVAANGSASFVGGVITLQSTGKIETVGNTSAVHVGLDKDASKVPFNIYDTANGNAVLARVNGDGSAEFAGSTTVGGGPVTAAGVYLFNGGTVNATRSGTSEIWKGFTTGNSTPTSTIKGNGSAYFASNVGIGTSSALRPLHVSQAGDCGVILQTTNAANNYEIWEISVGANASNHADLIFRTRSNNGAGGDEAMRILRDGKVGIGTTSADANLHIKGGYPTVHIERDSDTNYSRLLLDNTANDGGAIDGIGDGVGGLRFSTSDAGTISERVRIDSSGNLLLRGNTSTWLNNYGGAIYNKGGSASLVIGRTDATGVAFEAAAVFTNSANNAVGSISISNTTTNYNTSSDHRLKENVVDIADGITRVKQLQPRRFNFIGAAGTAVDGFIAHETQTVVPEAVTGTHNGVEVWKETDELPEGVSVGDNKLDDEGNTVPVMQGIDQSKLVPLLTAALQEAIAKIETLEAKVAALEAG